VAKSIGVTNPEYEILQKAKMGFQNLTGAKISWGAYLVALAAGALASYTIAGFSLRCPNCEESMEMRLVMPKAGAAEDSGGSALSSSRTPPGLHKLQPGQA